MKTYPGAAALICTVFLSADTVKVNPMPVRPTDGGVVDVTNPSITIPNELPLLSFEKQIISLVV